MNTLYITQYRVFFEEQSISLFHQNQLLPRFSWQVRRTHIEWVINCSIHYLIIINPDTCIKFQINLTRNIQHVHKFPPLPYTAFLPVCKMVPIFWRKKSTVNWLTSKKLALCIMYMTILPTLISTEVKGRLKSKILNTPENQFWRNADKRSWNLKKCLSLHYSLLFYAKLSNKSPVFQTSKKMKWESLNIYINTANYVLQFKRKDQPPISVTSHWHILSYVV